ncbi:MAG: ZIP family metal transporter [Planctomycetaceae bacterium]|nr:ZIP family metal transporter [Planctomycetaceae bacterium]
MIRLVLVILFLFIAGSRPLSAQPEPPAETSSPSTSLQIRDDLPSIPLELTTAQRRQRMWLLFSYSAAIILASMLGGYLPLAVRLTHTRMQMLMSFVGGLMLGVALFHQLLHAVRDTPDASLHTIMSGVGLGILVMFLLLRTFHFHQHDVSCDSVVADRADLDIACHWGHPEHAHDHDHDHDHHGLVSLPIAHPDQQSIQKMQYSWVGIALGLGFHTILDGAALAASCLRIPESGADGVIWGLATFLAILLHKPLDAISITTVMSSQGWSLKKCAWVNVSFALMCPLGALLAWWGIVSGHSHALLVSYLLAFSAGVFLCIALSDLLPEMQFHHHNQWALTITLLSGLALAWILMLLDPSHPWSS